MKVELERPPAMDGEASSGKAVKNGLSQSGSMPPPSGGGRGIPARLEAEGWRPEYQQPATGDQLLLERHPDGRKVRSDALPEYLDYRDWGCDLAPSCLRCPLVRCRYDEPGGARRLLQGSRDAAVWHRRGEGVGIDALAQEFSLSRRSVFRILARGRANGNH